MTIDLNKYAARVERYRKWSAETAEMDRAHLSRKAAAPASPRAASSSLSVGRLAQARTAGAAEERCRWAIVMTNKASEGRMLAAAALLIANPKLDADQAIAQVRSMPLDASRSAAKPTKESEAAHRASWQKAYRAAGVAK